MNPGVSDDFFPHPILSAERSRTLIAQAATFFSLSNPLKRFRFITRFRPSGQWDLCVSLDKVERRELETFFFPAPREQHEQTAREESLLMYVYPFTLVFVFLEEVFELLRVSRNSALGEHRICFCYYVQQRAFINVQVARSAHKFTS